MAKHFENLGINCEASKGDDIGIIKNSLHIPANLAQLHQDLTATVKRKYRK